MGKACWRQCTGSHVLFGFATLGKIAILCCTPALPPQKVLELVTPVRLQGAAHQPASLPTVLGSAGQLWSRQLQEQSDRRTGNFFLLPSTEPFLSPSLPAPLHSLLSSPSSHLSPQLSSPLSFCKRACKQTLVVEELA